MLFEALSQIASRTDVRLCWARAGLQQVYVAHQKAGLPAVAWSVWAARLRQGYGALAPAPKAFGAGAGDEGRTRDFLVGNEMLYH